MLTVIIITANRVTKMPQVMHNDVTGDDLVVNKTVNIGPGVTREAVVVYEPVDIGDELTVSPPVALPGATCKAVGVYKPVSSFF